MFKINSIKTGLSALSAAFLLAGCTDYSPFDDLELYNAKYDENFIAHYDEVDPNQSWDLSSHGMLARIKAGLGESAQTRGTSTETGWCNDERSTPIDGVSLNYSASDAFTPSHDLIQWIKKRLMEGDKRITVGDGKTNKEEFNQRFSMIATEESFTLIPIYQGIDNTTWDFHVEIKWLDETNDTHTVDRVLWKKSEGLSMKGERPDLKGNSIQDHVPNFTPVADLSTKSSTDLGSEKGISPGGDVRYETTRLASDIKSQAVTVSGYPAGNASINFSLHVITDNDGVNASMTEKKFWSDGRENPTSLTGNLVILPVQVDIPEYADYEIALVGCETALSSTLGGIKYANRSTADGTRHDYGDDDLNDIVFLLIGDKTTKKLPKLVNFNEVRKRYFFEDLGSVVDWDFNDVVLDMAQTIYVDGDKTKIKQTATLKHRCGTTPFNLFTKSKDDVLTELNFTELKVDGMIPGANQGAEMERSQTITLWDEEYDSDKEYTWRPEDNNIAIKVYTSDTKYSGQVANEAGNVDGVWSEYHEKGGSNVPRVLVADPSVWWTSEGANFPNMWKHPETAITTKPASAIENEFSNGSVYGIGSSRDFRYPYDKDGGKVIWDVPTVFDKWEPLWLSESFMECINQGYTQVHIEFGNYNTQFALLYREDYRKEDYKYGGDDGWKDVPSNHVYTFNIPSGSEAGAIDWFKKKDKTLSPSFGIQDLDNYEPDHLADNYYITINKVWLTKPGSEPEQPSDEGNKEEEGNISLYTTETKLNDWDSSIAINRDDFHEGDVIVVKVKEYNSGSKIELKAGWEKFATIDVKGDIAYTLTSSDAQDINSAKTLRIQGPIVTVSSVSKRCNHATKPTEGTYNFGEANMSFDLDQWAWSVKMEKNNFSSIKNGDVITITFAKNGGTATLKDLNQWNELNGLTKDFSSNPATITLTVNDNNRELLKNYGLAIQGQGVTFVKAVLTPASVEPDEPTDEPSQGGEGNAENTLVWEPSEPIQINKNWGALASNNDLNTAVNNFLKDYTGAVTITFTASEITAGDGKFHLQKNNWGGEIIKDIDISSKSVEVTLDQYQTEQIKAGINFQSGTEFKLSKVTIVKSGNNAKRRTIKRKR